MARDPISTQKVVPESRIGNFADDESLIPVQHSATEVHLSVA